MNKRIFIIAIIVFIIDQLSKLLASSYLINNSINIFDNFFNLKYATNTGAAWSILSGHQIILSIISIALIIVIFMFKKNFKSNVRNDIAFSLLYGGICGNLIDRVIHGYVIDFLDFKIFSYDYPIFNIADIAIVLGIILIIIAIFKGEDKNANNKWRRKYKTR